MKIRITLPGQEPREFPAVLINKAPLRLLDRLKVESKLGMKALAAMDEDGDPRIVAVMAWLAMNRAGEAIRFDALLDLALDDMEMLAEPDDPKPELEGEVEPDPRPALTDSVQGEGDAVKA